MPSIIVMTVSVYPALSSNGGMYVKAALETISTPQTSALIAMSLGRPRTLPRDILRTGLPCLLPDVLDGWEEFGDSWLAGCSMQTRPFFVRWLQPPQLLLLPSTGGQFVHTYVHVILQSTRKTKSDNSLIKKYDAVFLIFIIKQAHHVATAVPLVVHKKFQYKVFSNNTSFPFKKNQNTIQPYSVDQGMYCILQCGFTYLGRMICNYFYQSLTITWLSVDWVTMDQNQTDFWLWIVYSKISLGDDEMLKEEVAFMKLNTQGALFYICRSES